ncbi:MAG: MmcQ/YjbR family DNA-binding protein [Deltaproteobacteria bacterium]|nr:MAG: MmcQ/YjbR family DNA-binding protein [Deltaproteobacteria bacterium]
MARAAHPATEAALRAHALAKPEATEHFPWGERAIKVKGKVFLFMYSDATQLSLSTKLPSSGPVALMLPFAEPTGYGLGKAGWVSARFPAGTSPPIDVLCSWIDESYQAIAPAKLAALARNGAAPSPAAAKAKPRAPSAKPPPRNAKPATRKTRPAARTPATHKTRPATRTPATHKTKPASKSWRSARREPAR